jgi:serine/threonine-protein kinase RsbW
MTDPEFQIPSDPCYIKEASGRVLDYVSHLGLDKDTIFDIRLCLEEAIINAIKYGNKRDKDLPVYISYSFGDGRLEIVIRDQGTGFDYGNIPDPRSNGNILKHGGRGLFLIRNLMDKVEFNNSGNEIKMVKFLNGGNANGSKR